MYKIRLENTNNTIGFAFLSLAEAITFIETCMTAAEEGTEARIWEEEDKDGMGL